MFSTSAQCGSRKEVSAIVDLILRQHVTPGIVPSPLSHPAPSCQGRVLGVSYSGLVSSAVELGLRHLLQLPITRKILVSSFA